jgi:phospholipid transport system substrate-binding protein
MPIGGFAVGSIVGFGADAYILCDVFDKGMNMHKICARNVALGKERVRMASVAIITAVAVLFVTPAVIGKEAPQGVVEQFHRILLGVMKDADRLGYRGRLATLSPGVSRAFHLPVMARIVAGRHWKSFSRDEKKALVAAFTRMTTATYAHRFDGYGGEQFRTVGEVAVKAKTVMVKTQLIKSGGDAVNLDYLLRRFKSGWRVIDIYLDGSFSEVATRRSEYSSVLSREGLGALITTIDAKIAAYENGSAIR